MKRQKCPVLARMRRNWHLGHRCRERKTARPPGKAVWGVRRRLHMELVGPALPLPGVRAGGSRTASNGYVHPHFTAAWFTVAKRREQPQCPWTEDCVNVVCARSGMYPMKGSEIPTPATTWTGLEDVKLSEISLSQRHKRGASPLTSIPPVLCVASLHFLQTKGS